MECIKNDILNIIQIRRSVFGVLDRKKCYTLASELLGGIDIIVNSMPQS